MDIRKLFIPRGEWSSSSLPYAFSVKRFSTPTCLWHICDRGSLRKTLRKGPSEAIESRDPPFILKEFENVFLKKFLAPKEQIRAAAKLISEAAQIVSHASIVSGIRDPDDDQILSCALSAKADYLVTGDFDLLELKEFHGIRILTPGAFELPFED
jgi:putative PIN family toxin of toxin-antitoxin system